MNYGMRYLVDLEDNKLYIDGKELDLSDNAIWEQMTQFKREIDARARIAPPSFDEMEDKLKQGIISTSTKKYYELLEQAMTQKPCRNWKNEEEKKQYTDISQKLNRRDRAILAEWLAKTLMAYQKTYLDSDNWMELKQITYLDLHNQCPFEVSEKKVRIMVQSMMIKLSNQMINAESLMCQSIKPYICKHIVRALKKMPNAGAPKIQKEMEKHGFNISRRYVGKALNYILDV